MSFAVFAGTVASAGSLVSASHLAIGTLGTDVQYHIWQSLGSGGSELRSLYFQGRASNFSTISSATFAHSFKQKENTPVSLVWAWPSLGVWLWWFFLTVTARMSFSKLGSSSCLPDLPRPRPAEPSSFVKTDEKDLSLLDLQARGHLLGEGGSRPLSKHWALRLLALLLDSLPPDQRGNCRAEQGRICRRSADFNEDDSLSFFINEQVPDSLYI